MASVKGNIVLNGINTISGILFPMITFPYAARVLLPEGIGTVNFLNSIVSYIVLCTSLGIPLYAVKEIAKYKSNRDQRDKTAIEIMILSSLLCFLGYIAVWLLAKYVPKIHAQASLFYILSLTIVFTSIGVNWFYQGIEDFKFITIRGLIIRGLAAVLLFLAVKGPDDLLMYGFIVVLSSVGNNFINILYLKKHISFYSVSIRNLNILRHLRPSFQVFLLNIITSLYIQLNTIMIGFMSGDKEVGFFTAGTKIPHIGLMLITSIGTVLLPRCSHLLKIGDQNGFVSVIRKSLNLTLGLSLPITAGLIILANPVIEIFCGNTYMEAIPILYLNAPVIVFIALTNLIGIQILYAKDKVNLVIISVSVAAVINIIFNIMLIPSYKAVGAAISTLIAECSVLLVQMLLGKEYYPFKSYDLFNLKFVVATVIMSLAVWLSTSYIQESTYKLIMGVFTGVIVYFSVLMLMKESFFLEIVKTLRNKICNER